MEGELSKSYGADGLDDQLQLEVPAWFYGGASLQHKTSEFHEKQLVTQSKQSKDLTQEDKDKMLKEMSRGFDALGGEKKFNDLKTMAVTPALPTDIRTLDQTGAGQASSGVDLLRNAILKAQGLLDEHGFFKPPFVGGDGPPKSTGTGTGSAAVAPAVADGATATAAVATASSPSADEREVNKMRRQIDKEFSQAKEK